MCWVAAALDGFPPVCWLPAAVGSPACVPPASTPLAAVALDLWWGEAFERCVWCPTLRV